MDIVRQSLAITIVFALLSLALWLLRRKGSLRTALPNKETSRIEQRARLLLSNQHSVHWVRIENRDLVLAVHPAGVALLCDLRDNSEARPGT